MENNSENETNDVVLFRTFNERRAEVERTKDHWFYWFVGNIAALFAFTVIIFLGLALGARFAVASWFEFAVAVPLVYSAIFFHAQHAKAREYFEEYSFKSLSARALAAQRKILREDIDSKNPDERKKYLDFVIGIMKDLSTPPREIISAHPVKDEGDVKIGIVEKLGDIFKKFIPGNLA